MQQPYTIENWKIQDLYKRIDNKTLELPGFQRSIVWSKSQKDKFIESLKLGYPFGSLLVYAEEGASYILIDGLQRSNTIYEYFSKPTDFFIASPISKEIADLIAKELPPKNNPWESDEIHTQIENWFKQLPVLSVADFKASKGFKSEELLDFICKTLEMSIPRDTERILAKKLDELLESLREEADISNLSIPVIIYRQHKDKLPEVFTRLNKGGTQLNKYQIYAATWRDIKVPIANIAIKTAIKERFDDYLEKGFSVQGYDPDTFTNEVEFSLFEYLYGLGKILGKNHPLLFDSSADTGDTEADSCGFNLCTYAFNLDVPQMGRLVDELPKHSDLALFEKNLLESASEVEKRIQPYVGVNANRKKGLKKQEVAPLYHSEFQIITLIAKLYRMRFVEKQPEQKIDAFLSNLPYHYVYDIIDDYWRGSGNSKAYDLIQPGSRYEYPISGKRWKLLLESWFETQISTRRETSRVSLKPADLLFLKYIYAHTLTRFEDLSSQKIFEIEHLVAVAKLKYLAQEKGRGLPISCVANLALLPQDINREKGERGVYKYFAEDSEELKKAEEKLLFTKRKDFDVLEAPTVSSYIKFLRKRFENLKEQFFVLNGIT